MDEREWLTERFEQHRPHLRAVAYRMLGSVGETDDALQEAWLRIRDQDPGIVENMQAWLTTVVGRVCLNMLRSRRARRAEPSVHLPDPVVSLEEDGLECASSSRAEGRTERSGTCPGDPPFSRCRHAIVVCAWKRVIEEALATPSDAVRCQSRRPATPRVVAA
jgi:DNA-directed RNA polymerase specialized sigma24 family protein